MQELSTRIMVNSHAKNRISNAIINGIFDMKTIEFRAICALASQVPIKENDETIYSVSVKELAQLMNLNDKSSYAQLEPLCRNIAGKTIVIEISRNKYTKAWIPRQWFRFIVYDNGAVYYSFSPEIQPYLSLVRQAFVEIPTRLLMEFKSFYGIRLFLLAKQWYDLAKRNNQCFAKRRLSVEEIKNIFVLEGKYKSSADLARFVLKPAIKEVEQITKLRISFIPEKSKTKVTGVVFEITEVVDTVAVIDDKTDEKEIRARELMSKCECDERTINRLISQHSLERIIHWAEYTLGQNGIKNPAGYLTKMLKISYEDSEPAVAELPKVVKAPVPQQIEPSEEEKVEKLIIEDVSKYEEAFRKFRLLADEEQVQIYEEVLRRADGLKKRKLAVYTAKTIDTKLLYRNVFLDYYIEMMGEPNK